MDNDLKYLLSLQAVRDQASKVFASAKQGSLKHFDYDEGQMGAVADYVSKVIDVSNTMILEITLKDGPNNAQRDFGPDKYDTIPPHGRWQHFEVGDVARVDALVKRWSSEDGVDKTEITRRLVDLFFVSVLLDAGAGDVWRFKEPETGQVVVRSEGIAVASLHMFTAGSFSSDSSLKEKVDAKGLVELQDSSFEQHFQVSSENPMVGVSSRVKLLQAVGSNLLKHPEVFGELGRPGNLVDYLTSKASRSKTLDYEQLWFCLQDLLIPSWPGNRTVFNGHPIGDGWPLELLSDFADSQGDKDPKSKIQPFHKLTQWLAYSLSVIFERQLGFTWKNMHLGTGLPEYRNGGLFVDLGVLKLKPDDLKAGKESSGQELPQFEASDDVIVEWRALTVALLDELHKMLKEKYEPRGVSLSLLQMLEAGSWKSGRLLAAELRPETKCSPILVISDAAIPLLILVIRLRKLRSKLRGKPRAEIETEIDPILTSALSEDCMEMPPQWESHLPILAAATDLIPELCDIFEIRLESRWEERIPLRKFSSYHTWLFVESFLRYECFCNISYGSQGFLFQNIFDFKHIFIKPF
ncbi:urg3 [Fusarium coicis]|nr:urg3 [Fusarium coicis]